MVNALDIALGYISRGWSPVPVPYKGRTHHQILAGKSSHHGGGRAALLQRRAAECRRYTWPGLTGPVDVDLDTAEAIAVAPYLLPRTSAIFGEPEPSVPLALQRARPCGGDRRGNGLSSATRRSGRTQSRSSNSVSEAPAAADGVPGLGPRKR